MQNGLVVVSSHIKKYLGLKYGPGSVWVEFACSPFVHVLCTPVSYYNPNKCQVRFIGDSASVSAQSCCIEIENKSRH